MTKVLVTGCSGFIGSHLSEELLRQGHEVLGVDNLCNTQLSHPDHYVNRFFYSDINRFNQYQGIDTVFHLAAIGSVPRSINNPDDTHYSNVNGFFEMLYRAQRAGVRRVIYASSSSVYGDIDTVIKSEHQIGKQVSPYSASKRINEIYSEAFREAYGMEIVGLRFFNVYGPRQRSNSEYSAVIPKWASAMRNNLDIMIYGDGDQTRDFTFVEDVVKANINAMHAHSDILKACSVINVGTGKRTSLNELFRVMSGLLNYKKEPIYLPERKGDRKHSCADTTVARWALDFSAKHSLEEGLKKTI